MKFKTRRGVHIQTKQCSTSMLKHGYLKFMRNKSLSELIEVIVTQMMPKMADIYQMEQLKNSSNYRKRFGFDLPDIFDTLPSNIMEEIQREKTASAAIDVDDIINDGDGIYRVPSTTAANQYRTVNMQDGKCICTIVSEKGIVCRHMFAIIGNFGDTYNYDLDSINLEWLFSRYQLETDGSNNNRKSTNKPSSSNDKTTETNTCDDIEMQPIDTTHPIPIPKTAAKLNTYSASEILGHLKTIQGFVY